MMGTVPHETHISTALALQIAQKRAGRRGCVRHGGTLCCTCHEAPPRKSGPDCAKCHRLAQRDYVQRKKKREAKAAKRRAVVAGQHSKTGER